jgi:predicted AlkP superfamily pyrophosphatase or phosphodiesterase/broad specificity phosphatase PhoE
MRTGRFARWMMLLLLLVVTPAAVWGLQGAPAAPADPAAALGAPPAGGVRTIYLVRHGAYDSDDPRDEAVGKALLPIGIAQARLAGGRLRGLPFRFDEILASPFTRARETAQVIAGELAGPTVGIDPDLAECTPPTRRADVMAGEKPEDLARCAAQLNRLAERLFLPARAGDHRQLVVAHGNVIRYLVIRALAVDPQAWLVMSIGHASLTELAVDARGAVRVISVGDVGHIPPGLQSGAFGDAEPGLTVPGVPVHAAEIRPHDPGPTVLMISFDGFRWDYPELHAAPTFTALARDGVRAEALMPSFPSKTYPNHYTLVTGLRPERHGIVANSMWDPQLRAEFSLADRAAVEDGRWWDGEPIWAGAERQGVVTASSFWPGSEAEIAGVRPTYWKRFDGLAADEARVDEVLGWLDQPARRRPRLVTLYFSEPDAAGHRFGPAAPETGAAVAHVDAMLARLRAGIEARGLAGSVDWILVSDHGMTPTDRRRTIVLADHLDPADLAAGTSLDAPATFGLLVPQPGKEEALLRALSRAHPHLHAARKAEVPERFHYRAHRRIPALVIWADRGWLIAADRAALETLNREFPGGAHGYDPAEKDMRGIFIASGPSFRKGLKTPPLENVDVYPLLARLLRIAPAANDGKPAATEIMLAPGTP